MTTRILLSLFEFLLTVGLAVCVVYVNYRLSIRTNPDYDAEQELKNKNVGAAALLAACLVTSGMIVKNGIFPVVSMVRLALTSDGAYLTLWQVAGVAVMQILLLFVAAIFSVSVSLRLFGRLTRRIQEGKELTAGNPAVGIVLAAVVLVIGLFVSDSMSSLTKSLVPQAPLGTVEIMR
ncbi:MAG TPA: DUF350 domain-containing protein [Vicinamibacterales bacterium]|nr:DUF350 domain-containing protein [Vicinamibacterales bacterium]